jgi:hypothetical protein
MDVWEKLEKVIFSKSRECITNYYIYILYTYTYIYIIIYYIHIHIVVLELFVILGGHTRDVCEANSIPSETKKQIQCFSRASDMKEKGIAAVLVAPIIVHHKLQMVAGTAGTQNGSTQW